MLKKIPLSLIAVLLAFSGYAQTIVPTTAQNKSVVLEEFTGIYCNFCPSGHQIAQTIQDANPGRVSLINIHQGGYAVPNGNAPDFRTPYGNAIVNQSYSGGGFGYPAGTVNRHLFASPRPMANGTAMGRNYWAVSANDILAMPSNVNVAVEATIDIQTRILTVHVEAYYTGNSPQSTNLLNVALLQNNTKGPQTGGGAGNNYNHMHRLVNMVTGQWGEVINTTTSGSFVDKTYTYTIPDAYNSIPAILEDMEIVAFLTETQQEVATGSNTYPAFTGIERANDINIQYIKDIDPTCTNNIAPIINIKNEGQNTLTELVITYDLNGDSHTYNWTGNLTALSNEDVELPAVDFTMAATNTLAVSIPSDEDNSNNSQSLTFAKAPEGRSSVNIEIKTDNWGYEFRWKLLDSEGTTIDDGRNLGSLTTTNIELELTADCYTIVLTDTANDGGARVTITDDAGTQLFRVVGNWGGEKLGQFTSNGVLGTNHNEMGIINLYPNPTRDILNISNAENANIQVFDLLGKIILSKENISLNEQLNVSSLNAGVYFVKISKEGNTTTKKFIVSK